MQIAFSDGTPQVATVFRSIDDVCPVAKLFIGPFGSVDGILFYDATSKEINVIRGRVAEHAIHCPRPKIATGAMDAMGLDIHRRRLIDLIRSNENVANEQMKADAYHQQLLDQGVTVVYEGVYTDTALALKQITTLLTEAVSNALTDVVSINDHTVTLRCRSNAGAYRFWRDIPAQGVVAANHPIRQNKEPLYRLMNNKVRHDTSEVVRRVTTKNGADTVDVSSLLSATSPYCIALGWVDLELSVPHLLTQSGPNAVARLITAALGIDPKKFISVHNSSGILPYQGILDAVTEKAGAKPAAIDAGIEVATAVALAKVGEHEQATYPTWFTNKLLNACIAVANTGTDTVAA